MVAVVYLKRRITGVCIFGIVIQKLNYQKKLGPIVLLEIDKGLKVHFYYTILLFRLAVRLPAKSSEKPLLDIKKVAEQ